MALRHLNPRKALNKSFLKARPSRSDIEKFKANLLSLLDQINQAESEEFHKNIISKFLDATYYAPNHYINTKGRNDLVIHNGKNSQTSVGVIIEAKKPSSAYDMLRTDNINTKAFQELVLYYLRERITGKNLEVKHLIVTNIQEWFIFDANVFEKAFAENKFLIKQFNDFEDGRLSGKSTDFFYKEIAKPAIDDFLANASANQDAVYTYFDIREYDKPLHNADKKDDSSLIVLYKLLSPEHLLKLPFLNDNNTLDKSFYNELLHIIGLVEIKDGGKKLIGRKPPQECDEGSLIESVINQLDTLDKISRLKNQNQFGSNLEDRTFNVSLELAITWINRVLFLKLLEAQLISYHKGDKTYAFLNKEKIKNFDDLNNLFFQVLARQSHDRTSSVKALFDRVPYLNSSLFEATELEHDCLFISQLADNLKLPILSSTVLKDRTGKKKTGKLNTLEYLFSFLDAYDFSSEGSEEIQEENKTLINAAVLGLIFEKINGYKDGSFFTPGFITMYMSQETIRRAVVQKFNEIKSWNCTDIQSLYDKIEDKKEANNIINSIKICDPAVGSGHFLVSALNEIIAIKSDLRILLDRQGKTLRDYHVEVSNDELVVTDEEGKLFEYNPQNKESLRIQETLFHEKQAIIENCLFGVDINPNSVKICRLRLWIELLKNAYYKTTSNSTELETLPNIDINIKCGNSLISRFSLNADLKLALKKSKESIKGYKQAVQSYRHAKSKEKKREMESLIAKIKGDFRAEINANDVRKLNTKKTELTHFLNQHQLFEPSKEEKKSRKGTQEKLEKEIAKIESSIEETKTNKIFENAFEWRFEFPEVLNENGDFVGFDVVIANPPYGVIFNDMEKDYFKRGYPVSNIGKLDSYKLFYELSFAIMRPNYYQAFIAPNTFLYNIQSKELRSFILNKTKIEAAVELRKNIFEDAPDVVTVVLLLKYCAAREYSFAAKVAYPDYHYSNINKDEWQIEQNIPVEILLKDPEKKINLRRDMRLDKILDKIAVFPKLDDGFYLKQGTKPYGDKDLKEKVLLSKKQHDVTWEVAMNGRNIKQFHIDLEGDYVKRSEDLHSCLSQDIVNNPKIYFQRMRKISLFPRIVAAYDDNNIHGLYTCSVIYPKEGNKLSLKYVLALLNSHLVNVWYKNYDTDIEIKLVSMKNVPIPNVDKNRQKPFVDLVNKIMSAAKKNKSEDIRDLLIQLNKLVYSLYELSEDEIKLFLALTQNDSVSD